MPKLAQPSCIQNSGLPINAEAGKRTLLLCAIVFLALCGMKMFLGHSLVVEYKLGHQNAFADDAFYYFVLAKHLDFDGRSTFDGAYLTNGYHPLWMALLTLQYKLFGTSLLLTRYIEYFLGLGTLLFALLIARLPNLLLNLLYTAGLFVLLSHIGFNGMETTLFAFCLLFFTYVTARRITPTPSSSVCDGILAAACIFSRIDAAIFILPQLYFSAKSSSRRIVAFAVVGLCLLAYMVLNYHFFGTSLPISGQIKSLGNIQVNRKFLRAFTTLGHVDFDLYLGVSMWLVSPFILRATVRPALRNLILAFMLGFPVYFLRLAFFSSWRIWPWYNYPTLIGFVGCAPTALRVVQERLQKFFTYPQLAITAGVLATLVFLVYRPAKQKPVAYFVLNQLAIQKYASVLNGATIAMGDRAGNFAYQYPGGVDQLEGLMNDRTYFNTIHAHGDVKDLLCQRHVAFIASYEPDLGDYNTHPVATIRASLSQFSAPTITVAREDEIGRVSDLSQFNKQTFSEPNVYLYLWKLHCPSPIGEAALRQ